MNRLHKSLDSGKRLQKLDVSRFRCNRVAGLGSVVPSAKSRFKPVAWDLDDSQQTAGCHPKLPFRCTARSADVVFHLVHLVRRPLVLQCFNVRLQHARAALPNCQVPVVMIDIDPRLSWCSTHRAVEQLCKTKQRGDRNGKSSGSFSVARFVPHRGKAHGGGAGSRGKETCGRQSKG